MEHKNKKGNTSAIILIAVIVAITAGVIGYLFAKKMETPIAIQPSADSGQQRMCTQEAKLCSDGKTYVSRTGPNCEFAECPVDETANWQTYSNTKYGFEIKYPADWVQGGDILSKGSNKMLAFSIRKTSYTDIQEWFNNEFKDRTASGRPVASNLSIAGFPALSYEDPEGIGGCLSDFVFIKDSVLYDLQRGPATCSYSEDLFKKVISTFKFTNSTDETADWQTYKNDKYGFEFRYPKDWKIKSGDDSFLDIHLTNIEPGDRGCGEKFTGMEVQVGHLKDNNVSFDLFVKNAVSNEPGMGPSGKIEKIDLGNRNAFKVERSGWDGCNGPGYFIEQSATKYTYVFSGNGEGSDDVDKVYQILSTFKFTN